MNLKFGTAVAVFGVTAIAILVLSDPLSRQLRSLIEPGA